MRHHTVTTADVHQFRHRMGQWYAQGRHRPYETTAFLRQLATELDLSYATVSKMFHRKIGGPSWLESRSFSPDIEGTDLLLEETL